MVEKDLDSLMRGLQLNLWWFECKKKKKNRKGNARVSCCVYVEYPMIPVLACYELVLTVLMSMSWPNLITNKKMLREFSGFETTLKKLWIEWENYSKHLYFTKKSHRKNHEKYFFRVIHPSVTLIFLQKNCSYKLKCKWAWHVFF